MRRVEYWLGKDRGTHGVLDPDDPAWATAEWKEATLPGGPPQSWSSALPGGRFPEGMSHLDPATGRPLVWLGVFIASIATTAAIGSAGTGAAKAVIYALVVLPLLCLWAWCAAIFRAARAGEMLWVFLVAFLPGITMWFYVFRRGMANTSDPDAPSRLDHIRAVFSPLAVRQVLQVIREAERRFPEW